MIGGNMSRIRRLEEISLNSWPAGYTKFLDGWVLRYAGGYTNRSNSVYPIYDGFEPLEQKIEEASRFYKSKGLRTMFKLTADSKPAGLNSVLKEMGFEERDRALVMTRAIGSEPHDLSDADVASRPEEEWLELFFSLNSRARENQAWARKLLSMLLPGSPFIILRKRGIAVGCGFAVIESNHVGLFGIAVRESERRKGYGREITEKLLELGRQRGAETAYLQVDKPNESAISLYSKIGFREEYQHWYMVGE